MDRSRLFKSCLTLSGMTLKDFKDKQNCSYTAIYQALNTPNRSKRISAAIDAFISRSQSKVSIPLLKARRVA